MASTAARLDAAEVEDPRILRRVVAASFIGTTIEWYDFFLYGTAAALVFAPLFFPDVDPDVGTLPRSRTFAVGFAARPLGGVVFGHFGDRIGRKSMLVTSLLHHGPRDVPDRPACRRYASIGIAAPILLVLLRFAAGHRRRWRVGRRGADGRRARAEGQARLLRPVPADGRPAGLLLSTVVVHADPGRDHRGAVHRLGLAHPVPVSIVLVGVGLFIRLRSWSRRRSRPSRRAAPSNEKPIVELVKTHRATCSPRWACGSPRTALLHLHRVRAGLRRGRR